MRPQILFPLFAEVSSLKGVGPRVLPLVQKVAGPLPSLRSAREVVGARERMRPHVRLRTACEQGADAEASPQRGGPASTRRARSPCGRVGGTARMHIGGLELPRTLLGFAGSRTRFVELALERMDAVASRFVIIAVCHERLAS